MSFKSRRMDIVTHHWYDMSHSITRVHHSTSQSTLTNLPGSPGGSQSKNSLHDCMIEREGRREKGGERREEREGRREKGGERREEREGRREKGGERREEREGRREKGGERREGGRGGREGRREYRNEVNTSPNKTNCVYHA